MPLDVGVHKVQHLKRVEQFQLHVKIPILMSRKQHQVLLALDTDLLLQTYAQMLTNNFSSGSEYNRDAARKIRKTPRLSCTVHLLRVRSF